MAFNLGGFLPTLEGVLPDIERTVLVGEALAKVAPALIADIAAVQSDPIALGKLLVDLEAAWPTVIDAARAGTVAASEPPAAAA